MCATLYSIGLSRSQVLQYKDFGVECLLRGT